MAMACLAVLLAGAAVILAMRSHGILVLSIRSGSMQPSICSGDLVAIRTRPGEPPGLGQVVLHGGPDGDLLVKRVVGIPGDSVRFSIDGVERNGRPAARASACPPPRERDASDLEMTVPAGTVFVVGDNASISEDSRNYGAVPLSAVAGTLVGHLPLSRCECGDIASGERRD